jgi:very-short-patch-repair endonuclease
MNRPVTIRSRVLRQKATHAERLFWLAVRDRKILGLKFRRQYAIPFEHEGQRHLFIADFFCCEKNVVVEIDGAVHKKLIENDILRTTILEQLGMHVIRFRNEEIETDINGVILKLKAALKE